MRRARAVIASLLLWSSNVAAAEPLALSIPAAMPRDAGAAAEAMVGEADTSSGESSKQAAPARHQVYVWATTGPTFAYDKAFWSASVGAGYHIQAGLAPNVELAHTFFNSPTMWILRPGITWFVPVPFHPYIGGYFMHWFVNGGADRSGIGFRAGFSLGPIVSLAITYDHAISCGLHCDAWTPEISAGVAF
jgi:hypothetical protein